MDHTNGKPGADATGPRSAVSAGERNGIHYSQSTSYAQRSTADEMERARSALACIDAHAHDTWFKVGMGLRDEFDQEGWSIFDEWSRSAENYNEQENRRRWNSFKPDGGITIGTVYLMARDAGWCDDGTYRRPEPEEFAERARARAQAEAEQRKKSDSAATETAKKALAIWSIAGPATADNPYCRRKVIAPTETAREIDAEQAATVLGYWPSARNEKLQGRCLVVPIKIGGKLTSVQLIDGAGRKLFLASGVIGGGYWAAQPLPHGDGAGLKMLLGEGVATVLSARQAMPMTLGVATMSNTNMPAVARQMRERYSAATIVVLADLDKKSGRPDKYAAGAADTFSGGLAVPQFDDGPAPDRKDFNDLARVHGDDAVRAAIEAASVASCAGANNWPTPQPLISKVAPEPYPLDALPDGVREAVDEVHRYTQAPLALVASCALTTLSLSCQHLWDVRRDQRLCGPVSLNFLTIADSGERKSSVDSMFMAPLRAWQKARASEMKPELDRFKGEHAAWCAKRDGILAAIRELTKKDRPSEALSKRLGQLQLDEPRPPRVPCLFLADESPENLAWRLYAEWPSAGLISAEAGVVFGGHGMSADKVLGFLGLLNILWDGGEHSVGRKTSESFTLRGARLTCGLQVQESALGDFIERAGALARGTGFWARFLIAWPESTQGTRYYREPASMPCLDAYHARIQELVGLPVPFQEDGTLKPATVILSVDAKGSWIAFHDAIESELGTGGELRDIRDAASKGAENAGRLGALFQAYSSNPAGDGLEVTTENFDRASRIVAYHLSESRRFFGEVSLPEDISAAVRLDPWLIEQCRQARSSIPKNHVRQSGPRQLRDCKRLNAALGVLADLDRIRQTKVGRQALIEVNPALIGGRR